MLKKLTTYAFPRNERGQSLAGYVLALVLVSITVVAFLTIIGSSISGALTGAAPATEPAAQVDFTWNYIVLGVLVALAVILGVSVIIRERSDKLL